MITVYALIDPRTGRYRYVGRTSNMTARYNKHCDNSTNDKSFKKKWIKELKSIGLNPELEILLICKDKKDAAFWERHYTVLRVSPDGDIVEYESLSDAARKNNAISDKISLVCRGYRKRYRGFVWKFKD